MANLPGDPVNSQFRSKQWLLLIALLGISLGVLFSQSFQPHQILFANDGPFGFVKAEENNLPGRFSGTWRNLCFLGGEAPIAAPTLTSIIGTLTSAELFLKFYGPFTLFFVGFATWVFLRSLRFNPIVCLLGAVAASLNDHFCSIACWGLGTWNIAAGMALLAMAAMVSKSIKHLWARAILAGLAVGMAVMEGFDIGAILSLYVGAFVIFNALTEEGPAVKRALTALACEAVVVFFAGFIAVHTISSLVQTQIEGVAAMEQDVQTKQQRWNAATQWSLPKTETLDLVVPGLFGYRMSQHITDHDFSSAYWGLVGQDPRVPTLLGNEPQARKTVALTLNPPPNDLADLDGSDGPARLTAAKDIIKKSGIYWRYRGTGEFAGVMVALLALFAMANLCRKDSPYTVRERWHAGFWTAAAAFSLLAAWGRFGFLYHLLYHLPYFSTIRNPIKFLHPFDIAWIILAAYGLEALYRRYLRAPRPLQNVATLCPFDKRWVLFLAGTCALALGGYFIYSHYTVALLDYLQLQTFSLERAHAVIDFSQSQLVWFLLYLGVSALLMFGMISGAFSGPRMKAAWLCLGVLIIFDLSRADVRWVRYYDDAEKYSSNPILDFLADHPYEHRVIGKLEPKGPGSGIVPGFGELYFFWLQNDFPYHNIQALDFAQAPHLPDLDRAFLKAFELKGTDMTTADLTPAARLWRLTNTRYLLSSASSAELLNSRIDPRQTNFKIIKYFSMVYKVSPPADFGDVTVQEGLTGQPPFFALIDYTNALPRAKLFAHWQVSKDDEALKALSSPSFDPWQTVLVSDETPLDAAPGPLGADAGTVEITDYHPKRIRLEADAKTAAILWMADRIAPDWKVTVDGHPAHLLRCNYLMRGVYLTPGHHVVQMRFRPSLKTLYVSLAAILVGLGVGGYVIATNRPANGEPTPAGPTQKTADTSPLAPKPAAERSKRKAKMANPNRG